jgi:hypothetical protein
MAGIAVAVAALRASVGEPPARMWSAVRTWSAYADAVPPDAEAELDEIKVGLSDLPDHMRAAMGLNRAASRCLFVGLLARGWYPGDP